MLIEPVLFKAISCLNVDIANNLRIILLANDYKIRVNSSGIDWIKIVKELIEAKELGLLTRVLRYLRRESDHECGDEGYEIPLILLNSVNKVTAMGV